MPHRLLHQDLSAQSAALARGETTSAALTDAVLAEIARRNGELNAYLFLDAAGARRAAAQSDQRRSRGEARGPLDGLTVALKDNIDVAGMPTTAGMATRAGRMAERDAFVVKRLRDAGAVILGKLHMHEAALGTSSVNPHFGNCHNPRALDHSPGGSSGGSAAAVAASLCSFALGTDTMGSVRLPAAWCGVVGFKASYGLISTAGTVACCPALDHVGPLTRSRRDLDLVLPVLAQYDPSCADSREVSQRPALLRPRFVAARDADELGLAPEVAAAYARALQALRDRGHSVVELSLAQYPFTRARRAGLLMVEADLLVEHAADWQSQPQNFSPELAALMRYGERQSAAALAAAHRTVAMARVELARWFTHGDVVVLPTTPQPAHPLAEPSPANAADFTAIANMAGVPALSAPLPVPEGALPIGLQFIAPTASCATLQALDIEGVVTA